MKKLMALLLSMVMVLSLAACGGSATSSAAPAESTKTEEETTAPSSAPAARTGFLSTFDCQIPLPAYADLSFFIGVKPRKTSSDSDGSFPPEIRL